MERGEREREGERERKGKQGAQEDLKTQEGLSLVDCVLKSYFLPEAYLVFLGELRNSLPVFMQ